MLDNFKLTARERRVIFAALDIIYHATGNNDVKVDRWINEESRGYGNRHDKCPLDAARGMFVKWFRRGVAEPDVLLREHFESRPAAIWALGLGAYTSHAGKITQADRAMLQLAVSAYEDAFERMN